jgi:hypothetical protein
MKHGLTCLVAALGLIGFCRAQSGPPAINLTEGDVSLVQIELAPKSLPKLVIYFSKRKLSEFQELILENYGQPVSIISHGRLVAKPVIESQLLYKRNMITLRFPDLDAAVEAAQLLMP